MYVSRAAAEEASATSRSSLGCVLLGPATSFTLATDAHNVNRLDAVQSLAVLGYDGSPMADRIRDARALLTLVELLYRARRSAALHGVQPAPRAARALVPLGRKLRAAVDLAERSSPGEEQDEALGEVVRIGELIRTDPAWESIDGLVSAALRGVRGDVDRRPSVPRRLGQ